jgi:high-affinity iron transporter
MLLSAHTREQVRPEDGLRLFQINCAHCHGAAGLGDGPVADYLKELPTDLHAARVQGQSIEALYAIVTHGKDVMPPFKGELSADERWSVARYVKEQLVPSADQAPP